MDPNAARQKMIEKANLVLAQISDDGPMTTLQQDAVDLAEAAHDLDEWLRKGGFLPSAWVTDLGAKIFGSQPGRKQDVDIHVPHTVPTLVDDERPLKDSGEKCGYVYGDQGQSCTLDRGHEGLHG